MVKGVIKEDTDEELNYSEYTNKALESRKEDIELLEHLRETRGIREKEEEIKTLGLSLE